MTLSARDVSSTSTASCVVTTTIADADNSREHIVGPDVHVRGVHHDAFAADDIAVLILCRELMHGGPGADIRQPTSAGTTAAFAVRSITA